MSDLGAPHLPMRGRSGPSDAAALLRSFLATGTTGTLAVGTPAGVILTLLDQGKTVVRTVHGIVDEDATDVPFAFHAHELPKGALHGVPELPGAFPGARQPALRALPWFPGGVAFQTGQTSLLDVLTYAADLSWTGLLASCNPLEPAAALLHQGRLLAARGERHDRNVEGTDALRLLARHAAGLPANGAAGDPRSGVRLAPIPGPFLPLLAGALIGRKGDKPDGMHAGEHHALLLQGGVPLLRIPHPPAEQLGRFVSETRISALQDLPAPDDPPDWESRRYHLTLRGRDALDPMTDLGMRFKTEYGPSGVELLRTLERGLTVEATAAALGMHLDQLAAWIHKLEQDGLLRTVAPTRS